MTFKAPLDLTVHAPDGMYDPSNEHDACGVGMVTTLNKRPERKIVTDAIEVLVNLDHRGAVGAEENSGDGAGILMSMPDEFMRATVPAELPEAGHYAAGIAFLDRDIETSGQQEQAIAKIVHELFLGNYFAQTKALAFGKTADEVRAEGTPEEIVPARVFTGNRPTTSIFGVALTPFAVGELIALYEHITFVEGTVWGLDSYDQWGVELGKQLAKQITPAISQDDDALAAQDASTQSLIKFYRKNREF